MPNSSLIGLLRDDLKNHAGNTSVLKALLFDQRLRMLRWVRIKLAAARIGIPLIVPLFDVLILRWFSSQVGNDVKIGFGVKFAHPLGIVLGHASVIGNNCIIYQNVTLGGHSRKITDHQYPQLKDGVTVFPNSVIIGGVTIGEGATIGACSMVNNSVDAGDTVGGVPARSIKKKMA